MNAQTENIRKLLKEAVYEGGEMILNHFGGPFQVDHKEGINNLVTEVDQAVERMVTAKIKDAFPGHQILGEEYGSNEATSADYQWILDPIDGTVNFAHGIPLCCISLAITYRGELLMGAVYNPMMQEFFFAEKGQGAFLNDQPLRVSPKKDLEKACLVTGFPYKWETGRDFPLELFHSFVSKGIPVRRLGSAALDLCWVAAGRFDGFWEYSLQPWDVAAGYLMVREAGGMVTVFSGKDATPFDPQTLATNGHIHADMQAHITAILEENKTK